MVSPALKESNPELAAVLEQLESHYSRSYDFNNVADQATFAEGMTQIGRQIALFEKGARLKVNLAAEGIASITVDVN